MGQGSLSGVMDVLKRLFMGKARVRSLSCDEREAPAIFGLKRSVAVRRCEAFERKPRVFSPKRSTVAVKGEISCGDIGGRIHHVALSIPAALRVAGKGMVHPKPLVMGMPIAPLRAAISRVRILRKHAETRKGLELMAKMPQRRRNLVKHLRARPRIDGGAVLALFAPVLRDGVLKSILDKGSGDLLVWMDPKSRTREPFRVFLVRRLSGNPPLTWVWLPVEGENRQVGGGPPKP